jgi:hypothetical protein
MNVDVNDCHVNYWMNVYLLHWNYCVCFGEMICSLKLDCWQLYLKLLHLGTLKYFLFIIHWNENYMFLCSFYVECRCRPLSWTLEWTGWNYREKKQRRGRSIGKGLDRITRGLSIKICINILEGRDIWRNHFNQQSWLW